MKPTQRWEKNVILDQALTEADDAQLAKAARSDSQAFDMLYRRHVTAVFRYCLAQTGDRQAAEDLTAQTFLAALESLPRYRGRGAFAAWIFGIARRKCADYHRQTYRQPTTTLQAAANRPDSDTADPEERAHRRNLMDCVRHALRQLSDDRREVIQLRFWGGLSVRETAAVMRRSQGAVKMLASRAVADLRERCLNHDA